MTTNQRLDHLDIHSACQSLSLVRGQINSGQIEPEFALRQIERVSALLTQMDALQQAQAGALRFDKLYEVTRMLGTSLEPRVVLEQVMDAVVQLTGAERGFLMLRDDDGNLRVHIGRNFDQQTLDDAQASYSRTIVNAVINQGEAVLTTNAVEDPRFQTGASIMAQAMRSIMACPLRARGRIIGVAYVENRVVAGLFGKDDLATMEALTSQASIAIDNARLFSATDAELTRIADELRDLRRIDQRLNEKLDLHAVLAFTLETACDITEASAGAIAMLEGCPARLTSIQHRPAASDGLVALTEEDVSSTLQTQQAERDGAWHALLPIRRDDQLIAVVRLRREGQAIASPRLDLLERALARAAIAVENARLYSAVQAANRAKSEFVGIVAHDLKAPMTAIQGYADLLRMQSEGFSERQVGFLERISGTVRRMEILVSDLADISRIESGHFFVSEVEVAVDAIVTAVQDQTLPQLQAHGHTFLLEVEPALPALHTDYFRLIQVLTNLLSNACKYTPEGGHIGLRVARDGQRVRFSVSDTGIGLSAEGIRQLGTKFWRAEDDFTQSQPGTGLGFAITSSIVQQMGSRIHIESAPGQGSTFSFDVRIMERSS